MPLYIADYMADTGELGTPEHGAYLLLIMTYWQKGGLPTDDAKLARIARLTTAQWLKIKPTIAAFFSDNWTHKRIDGELQRAAEVSASYAARARQAAETRWSKQSSSNASGMLENAHSPSPSPKKDKIAAGAAPTANGKYEFEHGVIRLSAKDFSKWEKAFSHLDLRAELIAIAPWAAEQASWFHAVPAALAKKNRELKHRADQAKVGGPQLPLTPDGKPWPEGIV